AGRSVRSRSDRPTEPERTPSPRRGRGARSAGTPAWGAPRTLARRAPGRRSAPGPSERRSERNAEHPALVRPAARERVVQPQHAEEDESAQPHPVTVERLTIVERVLA